MNSDYKTNINYDRVVPRDLFNEALLLKCMGRLTLNIHNGNGMGLAFNENKFDKQARKGFTVGLMEDGYLTITNIQILIAGVPLLFRTTYNEKNSYPLLCTHNYNDIRVFNEEGEYTPEFIEFCSSFKGD